MKTNSILLLIILLFFVQISSAQKKEGLINWSPDRPLVWNDFKGKADNSSPFDALTMGNIGYRFEAITQNTEYKLLLDIGFDPKKSWVKAKKGTDKLLLHEQCHFDIFELYTRILVKKIEEQKILSGAKFSDKMEKVYNKTFVELIKFQQKYDKETNHSKNEDKQKEWLDKVKQLLDEHKAYSKKEIQFKI